MQELIFDRNGSRKVLNEALENVNYRLIIVCPWITIKGISNINTKLGQLLYSGIRISIGWGHLNDVFEIEKEKSRSTESIRKKLMSHLGWKYEGLYKLERLERRYPTKFDMKLLGTHEKILICDNKFAMLGSHNLLTSNEDNYVREAGLRTTDSDIVHGLIKRFDDAYCWEKDEDKARAYADQQTMDDIPF